MEPRTWGVFESPIIVGPHREPTYDTDHHPPPLITGGDSRLKPALVVGSKPDQIKSRELEIGVVSAPITTSQSMEVPRDSPPEHSWPLTTGVALSDDVILNRRRGVTEGVVSPPVAARPFTKLASICEDTAVVTGPAPAVDGLCDANSDLSTTPMPPVTAVTDLLPAHHLKLVWCYHTVA